MVRPVQALAAKLAHRRWPWWAGVAVWAVALFVLSGGSAPPSGPEFPFKDKLAHCLYFSGGAFCFVLGLSAGPGVRLTLLRAMTWGFVFAAVCGGLDEWHQSFTPGRVGNDPGDWLADVACGLLGGQMAQRFLQRFGRPKAGLSPMNRADAITKGTQSSKGS